MDWKLLLRAVRVVRPSPALVRDLAAAPEGVNGHRGGGLSHGGEHPPQLFHVQSGLARDPLLRPVQHIRFIHHPESIILVSRFGRTSESRCRW